MEMRGQFHARGTHWTGAILDAVAMREISSPYRESNPGHPACSLVTILNELALLLWQDIMWLITNNQFICHH